MALDLETAQCRVSKRTTSRITPRETEILLPYDLEKALSVNTCSDLEISQHVIDSVASNLEKTSMFADAKKIAATLKKQSEIL